MKNLIFIDTETTGLKAGKHEVIEIAILTETPDGEVEEWSTKIKPRRIEEAHPKALEINGYAANSEAWDDAPDLSEVAPIVAEKLRKGTIIGHNPKFDIRFVEAMLKEAGIESRISHHVVDTVTLAHEHLTPCGIKNRKLDTIRDFFGWSAENAHTAMQDVRDTRYLYHKLIRATPVRRWFWKMQYRLRQRGISLEQLFGPMAAFALFTFCSVGWYFYYVQPTDHFIQQVLRCENRIQQANPHVEYHPRELYDQCSQVVRNQMKERP